MLLVEAAAKALIGSKLDDAALKAAAAACSAACRPIDDKRGTIVYRTKVAGVLLKRTAVDRRQARQKRNLKIMAKLHVSTTINGEPMEFLCEPHDTMLDALRGPLGLTGSKEGCASGDCGACSITLDDRLVCSCLMLAVEAEGHELQHHRGHGRRATSCIRCSRNSWKWRPCSAASAPRACWSPPTRCCEKNLEAERGGGALLARRQSLPLHRLRQDRARGDGNRR